jgi:hypothetical protein
LPERAVEVEQHFLLVVRVVVRVVVDMVEKEQQAVRVPQTLDQVVEPEAELAVRES